MKILAIFDFYPPHVGGAEAVYENVCRGLSQRGHDVTVITQKDSAESQDGIMEGVKVKRIRSWSRVLFPLFALKSALKQGRDTDVLLTSLYSSSLVSLIAKIVCRKKAYIIVHEYIGKRWFSMDFSFPRALFLYISEWLALLPMYDGYVCVSESTKRHLSEKITQGHKLHVIHNGLDQEIFFPREKNATLRVKYNIPLDKTVMMFAGRPGYFKGLRVLLEALNILREKEVLSFHTVLLLSKRPLEKYQEAMEYIRKNKLNEHVTVLDSVGRDEVPAHFAMADVGVVPSLTEGFGFSAAEFCAMGLPVVVSKVDSLPEVVSGKVVFAKAGNPMSLASALLDAERGEYELHVQKDFSWSGSVEQYEQVLKAVKDSAVESRATY